MESLDLRVESIYTRGLHLAPDVPVDEKGGIVSNYEVILFPEDYNGGVMVDGVFYQSLSGYFVCCKPAQHRKFKLPVRCYILGVSTQDPQLNAALKSLPPYAPHSNLPVLMDLFRKFLYIPTHTAITDRLAVYASAAAFLQLLLQEQYQIETVLQHNPRRHQEALIAANQYLKDHLEEDVDLEKLAKDSHLHPTYFHKLFTEAFGKTPAQQLMHHRITASREYLRRDDYTIAEIARKCGFSSQSYFCRKYKEISLETPSRFRRAIRNRRKKI